MFACVGTCVLVRGQFPGVTSLFPHLETGPHLLFLVLYHMSRLVLQASWPMSCQEFSHLFRRVQGLKMWATTPTQLFPGVWRCEPQYSRLHGRCLLYLLSHFPVLEVFHNMLPKVGGVTTVSLNFKFWNNFHRFTHGKMHFQVVKFTIDCYNKKKIKMSFSANNFWSKQKDVSPSICKNFQYICMFSVYI